MRRRTVLWLTALGVAGLGLAWVLRPAPVPVETAQVTRGPLRETLDEQGETQVRDRYVVAMPAAGALERVDLRAGDSVRAGAIVAWVGAAPLDPRTSGEASARLARARDAERVARAQVTAARAALEQAGRDRARAESLAVAELIAPEGRERAELALVARRQELEVADFRAQVAAHEREEAEAMLTGARTAPRGARVPLHAPVTGQVLRVLEASARVLPAGAPILELGDPARLEVRADYLSTDATRLAPGDSAWIEAWGGGAPLPARVRRVEPSGFTKISALGVEEQRVPVILDLDRGAAALGDRFRVEVRVIVWSAPAVLQVPVSALFRQDSTWCLYVVRDGRARRRTVEVGHRGAAAVEVLGGLTAGEEVIRYPGDQVADGTRVE